MCTGDPRKMKQLLKEKKKDIFEETQFSFGERFEFGIIRTAKSKQNQRKFSRL